MQNSEYDPIVQEAIDAGVYLPDGEPYPLPELDAQEIANLEDDTAIRVATVRGEQDLRIANLGLDQTPHFLVNDGGAERCGSDGEPWPCRAWRQEIEPAAVAESEGLPQVAEPYTAAEVAMAAELGITAAEVRERMRAR